MERARRALALVKAALKVGDITSRGDLRMAKNLGRGPGHLSRGLQKPPTLRSTVSESSGSRSTFRRTGVWCQLRNAYSIKGSVRLTCKGSNGIQVAAIRLAPNLGLRLFPASSVSEVVSPGLAGAASVRPARLRFMRRQFGPLGRSGRAEIQPPNFSSFPSFSPRIPLNMTWIMLYRRVNWVQALGHGVGFVAVSQCYISFTSPTSNMPINQTISEI